MIADIIDKKLSPLITQHLDLINAGIATEPQNKFCMKDQATYNGLTITDNLNTAVRNAYIYGSYGYKPTPESQPMLIIPKGEFIDEELKTFFKPLQAEYNELDYNAFVKPVPTSLIPFILKSPLQIELTDETFNIIKESVDYMCKKNPYL